MQIIVACGVLKRDGRYLITQRNSGEWEFPGGKIEFGETPEECLVRELAEEIGITVSVDDVFAVSSAMQGDKHILLLAFHCVIVEGDVQHLEVEDHRWVLPEELTEYEMSLADLPLVEKLIQQVRG